MDGRFRGRHVKVHGQQVSYRRAGQGETVVLVHGLAGSSRAWKDVMPTLAENHDVIAVDLFGHGESAKQVADFSISGHASSLRDVLVKLDVDHATIVGHSLGGGVAMQFAYQYPERCDRLVLIASGGLGREVSWLLRAATLPFADRLLPAVAPGWLARAGGDVSRVLSRVGVRNAHLDQLWRSYSSLAEAENRAAFARTVRSVINPRGQTISAIDRLPAMAGIPTLIVWGEHDRIIPVAHAHLAHEAIIGSRLLVLPGVGHFPQSEAPAATLAALHEFLAETAGHLTSRAS